MKFPLYSRVTLAVDLPTKGLPGRDVATMVQHHAAPTSASKPGDSLKVFNVVRETLVMVTLRNRRSKRCGRMRSRA